MKNIKFIALFLVSVLIWSCEEEIISYALQDISAPENVSAVFDITQDDTGLVTITPSGEGVNAFKVFFGDSDNTSETVSPGGNAQFTYPEGQYDVRVVGEGATGLTSEFARTIMISFRAPENLEAGIVIDNVNPSMVTFAPTAEFAMTFDVYFGDVDDEVPTAVLAGESITKVYDAPGTYTIRIVAKGAGVTTTEVTEDIVISAASDPVTFPISFESFTVNYAFVSFGPDGEHAAVVDNPNKSGINTTDKVAQFNKVDGSEVWAGTFLTMESPIDFDNNDLITVKVHSPKVGATVKLKVENLTDGSIGSEIDQVTSVADAWEELTFDFSMIDKTQSYQKVVIFFDFGNAGDNSTYYYDDVVLKSSSTCIAETSENIDPAMGDINWTFMTNDAAHAFEPFGDIASEIVANPVQDMVNSSCAVQRYAKTIGCQTWSGVGKGLDNAIDLTTNTNRVFGMKVLAEDHVTQVTLRIEFEPFPNTDPAADVVADITKVGEWEQLYFDFSAHADKTFKSVIVYFDRNNPCDDAVYYFDDIEQLAGLPSAALEIPMTFDVSGVDYTMGTFNGASYAVVANPAQSGANTSMSNVGAITNAGVNWEGGAFSLGNPVDFNNDNKKITMKFWSDVTVPVLLKFEGGVNGERQTEVVASHGGTGWEELEFNFATDAIKSFIDGSQGAGEAFVPTGQYATMVIFIDGPGNTAGTFYIDDIEQVSSAGALGLPISFDDPTVMYDFGTFNGASYAVVTNPDQAGTNTSMSNVGAITNAGVNWEGGAFNLQSAVDFSGSNKTISMQFWSDVAVPVLLKFEGGLNGERQTEVVSTHTGSGWETITFNFATEAIKSFIDGSQGAGEAFVPTGEYATIVIFVDGPGMTAGTFYIDDIVQQ